MSSAFEGILQQQNCTVDIAVSWSDDIAEGYLYLETDTPPIQFKLWLLNASAVATKDMTVI